MRKRNQVPESIRPKVCPKCNATLVGIMAMRNHLRWHVSQGHMTEFEKERFQQDNKP